MSKIVAVPDDLYSKVAEVAAKDRVSVDEFISGAVANQLASREYIDSRARCFNKEDFEKALEAIPDVDADEVDRV